MGTGLAPFRPLSLPLRHPPPPQRRRR